MVLFQLEDPFFLARENEHVPGVGAAGGRGVGGALGLEAKVARATPGTRRRRRRGARTGRGFAVALGRRVRVGVGVGRGASRSTRICVRNGVAVGLTLSGS